jgi:hypothetical protein
MPDVVRNTTGLQDCSSQSSSHRTAPDGQANKIFGQVQVIGPVHEPYDDSSISGLQYRRPKDRQAVPIYAVITFPTQWRYI